MSVWHREPNGVNINAMQRPTRSYRGADAEERVSDRRERLLTAGIEIFGTTGYRTATVAGLCARAGLTKRYFYESFEDSEALLLGCYQRAAAEIHQEMVRAVAEAPVTVADQLQAALAGYFGAIDADQRLARITLLEILGVSATVDAAYRAETDRFANSVELLAGAAFTGSGLPTVQRHIVAQGIIGAITTIAAQWVLDGRRQPRPDVIAGTNALVLGVLDRLARGTG